MSVTFLSPLKIDTGASVMSDDTYHQLKHLPQLSNDYTAFDSPRGRLECLGLFTTISKYRGQQYKFNIHMIKIATGSNLLGHNVAVAMGLVKRVEEVQSTVPGQADLARDCAVPYSIHTARRMSAPLLLRVKIELERMLKCDVIEEIKEPTEWFQFLRKAVK